MLYTLYCNYELDIEDRLRPHWILPLLLRLLLGWVKRASGQQSVNGNPQKYFFGKDMEDPA